MPERDQPASPVVRFYEGVGADARGRTLAQVQAFDDRRMEAVHDFIQWLFPLEEASAYNPDAPLLTADDINAFRERPGLRDRLRASFVRFLAFLGLSYDGTAVVGPRDVPDVFRSPNHNWLRVTRVLASLTTLGLGVEARAFHAYLDALYRSRRSGVTAETFAYWSSAVKR